MVERKEIEHIAELSRLDISSDIERLTKDMQSIIGMVGKLSEVTLLSEDYPLDMTYVNNFREDEIVPSMPRDRLLANAASVESGCISVPKVLGGGEE